MENYLSSEYINQVELFCNGYKAFLDRAKTERECIRAIREVVQAQGFGPLPAAESVRVGGKYYCVNRNKSMALIVMGRSPLCQGCELSPRTVMRRISILSQIRSMKRRDWR